MRRSKKQEARSKKQEEEEESRSKKQEEARRAKREDKLEDVSKGSEGSMAYFHRVAVQEILEDVEGDLERGLFGECRDKLGEKHLHKHLLVPGLFVSLKHRRNIHNRFILCTIIPKYHHHHQQSTQTQR